MTIVSEAKAPASSGRALWGMILVFFACWVVALLDRMVVTMLIPGIKASLRLSDTEVSLLYGAAFSECFALAGLGAGWLADRYSRRKLLAVGVAGWSLATMGCGLAGSFVQFFAARVLVGVFQSVLTPASFSMVTDGYPPERRGRAIGLLVSAGAVGVAASSVVGGLVFDFFGSKPPIHGPFGLLLAPWQSTLVVAGLPGLALIPAVLALKEPARQKSAAEARAFRLFSYLRANLRTFGPLFAGFTLTLMASYGLVAWFPTLCMRNLHMPAHEVGPIIGLINCVTALAAAVIGGSISDRVSVRDPKAGRLTAGLVMILLFAAGLSTLVFGDSALALFAGFGVFAFFVPSIAGVSNTVFSELAPPEARGRIIAFYQFLGYVVGLGVAPTLVALITDRGLHDEGRLNVSMLLVAEPCLLLAAILVGSVLPGARKAGARSLAQHVAAAVDVDHRAGDRGGARGA
jgi:MFS family permease